MGKQVRTAKSLSPGIKRGGVSGLCEGLACIFSLSLPIGPGMKIWVLGLWSGLKPHSPASRSSALPITTTHRHKFQAGGHDMPKTWQLGAGSKQEILNRWRLTGKEAKAFWADCGPGRALATVSDFIWTRSTRVGYFYCWFTNDGPAAQRG